MRLYIRMKNGETYYPWVEGDEEAREVIHKIATGDGLMYLNVINMAIDAGHVLIACPHSVIDRKQEEAPSG